MLLSVLPRIALADPVDDFLFALAPYAEGNYAVAAQRLRPLVGVDPPRVPAPLVASARLYYAASLLFVREEPEAVEVLRTLLRDDPTAEITSTRDFTPEFVRLFQTTRAAMADEIRALLAARERERQRTDARRRAAQATLQTLLTRERVVVRRPRWTAFLPFGMGQFANGEPWLGVAFAGVEIASLTAGVAGFVYGANLGLPCTDGVLIREQCSSWYTTAQVANFGGFGLFVASVLGGIVQANLAYRPDQIEYRRRSVPSALRTLRVSAASAPVGHGVLLGAALRF